MMRERRGVHSLLGSNDLRGGCHTYSPDVLIDNWFDAKLGPHYRPILKARPRDNHRLLITPEKRQAAFDASGRTHLSVLTPAMYRSDTIPEWLPKDPPYGHPPITSPFETIYECTMGDPDWRKKPIAASENFIGYQNINDSDRFITEHRASFKNPNRHQLSRVRFPVAHPISEELPYGVETPHFQAGSPRSVEVCSQQKPKSPISLNVMPANSQMQPVVLEDKLASSYADDEGYPISSDRLMPTSSLGKLRKYVPPELVGTPYYPSAR